MAEQANNQTAVLGFSGGVDSTAACLLLQDQGFRVAGLYFDVMPEGDSEACENARKRAEELGISLRCVNVSKLFEEAVIADFCRSYQEGRTPNPCVICNPQVKFRTLSDYADEIGASRIATGHYAQVKTVPGTDRCAIYRAACLEKDQSYMLYRLEQPVLNRLLLPLGQVKSKDWVRSFVEARGIGNFAQKDSQDICFLPKGTDYASFLESRGFSAGPGTFCDETGRELAPSKGYLHYTIGQRKGFGIGFGKPLFVTRLDAENNRVYLGEEKELFTQTAEAGSVVFTEKEFCKQSEENHPFFCTAKIRSRAKDAPCKAVWNKESKTVTLRFEKPERAPTPGQSVVLYDGDRVIGGGILK